MGLVAEEAKKGGYLGSGMTIEAAREKAKELSDDSRVRGRARERGGTSEVPFSARGAKRVFEAALQESQNVGMNYIAPEHIAAAAAELDDVTMVAFFEAVGVDPRF